MMLDKILKILRIQNVITLHLAVGARILTTVNLLPEFQLSYYSYMLNSSFVMNMYYVYRDGLYYIHTHIHTCVVL